MTLIKNKDGGMDNLDLSHAKDIVCEECGCKAFKQSMMLKSLSALMSPTGKESIIPISVFACEMCGHVNEEFTKMETGH